MGAPTRVGNSSQQVISFFAAKNEYEHFKLIIGPGSGTYALSVQNFTSLGTDQKVQIRVASFDQTTGFEDTLTPVNSGETITLNPSLCTPIWITVYVPKTATGKQTYYSTFSIGSTNLQMQLYVYDFSIPEDFHFRTQVNIGVGSDAQMTELHDYRFTPKSATWPSSFKYTFTWETAASGDPICTNFYDESDQGVWGIHYLAGRYLNGTGWGGRKWTTAMGFQFVDNSTPRPSSFCGISRGSTHEGTEAYNTAWCQYLTALNNYLVENGFQDQVYYYVQNEPNDQAAWDLAHFLCNLTKHAAPNLRIAVSEEPTDKIIQSTGPDPCGYDIWISYIQAYKHKFAIQRQKATGEEVWFYSLDQDVEPYFNPMEIGYRGLHDRIIPWISWTMRSTGWAYYAFSRFYDSNSRPTVRAELLREGIEDYEYLYRANGNNQPQPGTPNAVDAVSFSVAKTLTDWFQPSFALQELKHQLGLYNEGSRATLPILIYNTTINPRGSYYINFQGSSPTADPLVYDGKTWIKMTWCNFDSTLGYGFYSTEMGQARTGYASTSHSVVENSFIYNDYGRLTLFLFALENGRYNVTISVGYPDRGYANDPHNAWVEGVKLIDDVVTTSVNSILTNSTIIDLNDGYLSLEFGGRSESIDDYAYTFMEYMMIEPV
eukprot:Anaeramoba_ignava/c16137_g1_i1.p1 GENE.c16137_g1_i1~~c16137_g1_i1.p1  ORF type:complete len:658 (+),score=155.99 c16137_g1_i1:2369-4342(+)